MKESQVKKLKKGAMVVFKGYEDLPEGIAPLLKAGEEYEVTEVCNDGEGEVYLRVKANEKGETEQVFPDEVDMPSESKAADKDEEADTAADAEPKAKATTKAKAAKKSDKKKETVKAEKAEKEDAAPAKATQKPKKKAATKTAAKSRAVVVTDKPEVMEGIAYTPTLREMLKGTDALEAAASLVAQAEQTYFNLGGVLAHIKANKTYETIGYAGKAGFNQYVETELGVRYEKAMKLIGIYNTVTELGIDESVLGEIGWTKMRELVRVLDDTNMADLLEYAKNHTRAELEAYISEGYVSAENTAGSSTEKSKRVKFTFTAFGDEAEYIKEGIQTVMERFEGIETEGDALLHIVREWVMNESASSEAHKATKKGKAA